MPTISQHTLLSQLTLLVEEHDLTGYVFHSIDGNDSIIGLCWEWFIIIQDWNSCHERLKLVKWRYCFLCYSVRGLHRHYGPSNAGGLWPIKGCISNKVEQVRGKVVEHVVSSRGSYTLFTLCRPHLILWSSWMVWYEQHAQDVSSFLFPNSTLHYVIVLAHLCLCLQWMLKTCAGWVKCSAVWPLRNKN